MVQDSFLESLVELAVVEEYIWIVEPAVEMPFDGLDGLNDAIQLLVSGQDDKRCVGLGAVLVRPRGFYASRDEYSVILVADFPARDTQMSEPLSLRIAVLDCT